MHSGSRIWLLALVLPGPYGRWWTAALIFGVLIGISCLAELAATVDARLSWPSSTVLFFGLALAYIVPIFQFITERSRQAMRALAPLLDDADAAQRLEHSLEWKPRRWTLTVLALASFLGLTHNWVLFQSPDATDDGLSTAGLVIVIGYTMLIWLVMTFAIAALVTNARLFGECARRVRIDLLNTRALMPFASIAVSSTLALVGAQATFPVLMLDQATDRWAFIPGLIATFVPMLGLFLWPVWPVHRRLAARKRRELARLDGEIAVLPRPPVATAGALDALNAQLAYRREILQASEWPFDLSVVSRLALYLVIPPLTWIGAALIENLVDAAL